LHNTQVSVAQQFFDKVEAGDIDTTRFMPAEYQGGDDYYKPKKNPFESKDEKGFNIRAYNYYDEKTGKYVENPDALGWMDIGHRNDDNKAGMWYLDDNNGKIEQANVSEYQIHEDLFNDISEDG
jgi:hypothetical protein